MSSYYAAYYGSGVKLNEKEFDDFVKRYLEVNKTTKGEIVKENCARYNAPYYEDNAEDYFDNMVVSNETDFIWGADLSVHDREKRRYFVTCISPDDCDGMRFQPYYTNGKANVYCSDKDGFNTNPDYVDFIGLRGEISYMFFSDCSLDSVKAFERRPYGSYEEFKQEFKDKMAEYLPDDFDWDAHIGRFNYACYA